MDVSAAGRVLWCVVRRRRRRGACVRARATTALVALSVGVVGTVLARGYGERGLRPASLSLAHLGVVRVVVSAPGERALGTRGDEERRGDDVGEHHDGFLLG